MIIDKPRIDRKSVLAEEAELQRIVDRLCDMTDLLASDEELGEPVRKDDRIVVPIVRHRGSLPRYGDVVRRLARKRLRTEML